MAPYFFSHRCATPLGPFTSRGALSFFNPNAYKREFKWEGGRLKGWFLAFCSGWDFVVIGLVM